MTRRENIYLSKTNSKNIYSSSVPGDIRSRRLQKKKKKKKKKIYIYIIVLQELGYLNIYCNSKFHASCEAIIRQLPEITVTITEI